MAHLRIASTIAEASFSTLEWFNSGLCKVREKKATGQLFWFKVAESAKLKASVSTTNGIFSAMIPSKTSANSDFKSLNDRIASSTHEKAQF